MSGLEFFIWVVVIGFIVSRTRIHKWQETKKGQNRR